MDQASTRLRAAASASFGTGFSICPVRRGDPRCPIGCPANDVNLPPSCLDREGETTRLGHVTVANRSPASHKKRSFVFTRFTSCSEWYRQSETNVDTNMVTRLLNDGRTCSHCRLWHCFRDQSINFLRLWTDLAAPTTSS